MNQGLDTTGNKKNFQPMALLEGKVDFYGYIMLHIYVDCRLYDVFVLSIMNIIFTKRIFFIGILDWKPNTLGVDRKKFAHGESLEPMMVVEVGGLLS